MFSCRSSVACCRAVSPAGGDENNDIVILRKRSSPAVGSTHSAPHSPVVTSDWIWEAGVFCQYVVVCLFVYTFHGWQRLSEYSFSFLNNFVMTVVMFCVKCFSLPSLPPDWLPQLILIMVSSPSPLSALPAPAVVVSGRLCLTRTCAAAHLLRKISACSLWFV